jgi:hypothetical protein
MHPYVKGIAVNIVNTWAHVNICVTAKFTNS